MSADPDPVNSIYVSGEYLARNPEWHAEESPWKATQVQRMLDRHQLRPRSICEIGCGAGEVLRQLQMRLEPGVDFRGYDVSPQAMELCRPKSNPNLRFVLGAADSVPDNSQDLVLVLDVLEHLDDYLGFLRMIQPKGIRTIFHIPLDLSVQTVLRPGGLEYVRDAYGHLHYFSKETALRSLEDTGFHVEDWFYTRRAVEEVAGTLRRRLLKTPRRMLFKLRRDLAARTLGGFSLLVLTTAADR